MTVKSYSFDQTEILEGILLLCGIDRFDMDMSYGNGSFYKKIPEPKIKMDISPQRDGVICACSTNTGIDSETIGSAVFDPPFLTYIKNTREHNSVMAKRFGGYWRYDELEAHYKDTLKEAARILAKKGVFVFKCQDIIHNHKMHCTHANILEWSRGIFRLKDLFVLAAKSRMPMPVTKGHKPKKQRHARIHHSYFLVLEKI